MTVENNNEVSHQGPLERLRFKVKRFLDGYRDTEKNTPLSEAAASRRQFVRTAAAVGTAAAVASVLEGCEPKSKVIQTLTALVPTNPSPAISHQTETSATNNNASQPDAVGQATPTEAAVEAKPTEVIKADTLQNLYENSLQALDEEAAQKEALYFKSQAITREDFLEKLVRLQIIASPEIIDNEKDVRNITVEFDEISGAPVVIIKKAIWNGQLQDYVCFTPSMDPNKKDEVLVLTLEGAKSSADEQGLSANEIARINCIHAGTKAAPFRAFACYDPAEDKALQVPTPEIQSTKESYDMSDILKIAGNGSNEVASQTSQPIMVISSYDNQPDSPYKDHSVQWTKPSEALEEKIIDRTTVPEVIANAPLERNSYPLLTDLTAGNKGRKFSMLARDSVAMAPETEHYHDITITDGNIILTISGYTQCFYEGLDNSLPASSSNNEQLYKWRHVTLPLWASISLASDPQKALINYDFSAEGVFIPSNKAFRSNIDWVPTADQVKATFTDKGFLNPKDGYMTLKFSVTPLKEENLDIQSIDNFVDAGALFQQYIRSFAPGYMSEEDVTPFVETGDPQSLFLSKKLKQDIQITGEIPDDLILPLVIYPNISQQKLN